MHVVMALTCGILLIFVLLQATEHAKEEVKTALKVLNSHLETRTYLVGERISLADISVACNLLLLYQWVCI